MGELFEFAGFLSCYEHDNLGFEVEGRVGRGDVAEKDGVGGQLDDQRWK
jgi:hypothetical protein